VGEDTSFPQKNGFISPLFLPDDNLLWFSDTSVRGNSIYSFNFTSFQGAFHSVISEPPSNCFVPINFGGFSVPGHNFLVTPWAYSDQFCRTPPDDEFPTYKLFTNSAKAPLIFSNIDAATWMSLINKVNGQGFGVALFEDTSLEVFNFDFVNFRNTSDFYLEDITFGDNGIFVTNVNEQYALIAGELRNVGVLVALPIVASNSSVSSDSSQHFRYLLPKERPTALSTFGKNIYYATTKKVYHMQIA